jgi:hypothetical protein
MHPQANHGRCKQQAQNRSYFLCTRAPMTAKNDAASDMVIKETALQGCDLNQPTFCIRWHRSAFGSHKGCPEEWGRLHKGRCHLTGHPRRGHSFSCVATSRSQTRVQCAVLVVRLGQHGGGVGAVRGVGSGSQFGSLNCAPVLNKPDSSSENMFKPGSNSCLP